MINVETKPTFVGRQSNAAGTRSLVAKRIADLQWRINFTEMKLQHWPEQENCRWMNLVRMQEHAKQELMAVAI